MKTLPVINLVTILISLVVRSRALTQNLTRLKISGVEFQGVTLLSDGGKPFEAYRGIPYAVPPIGDLRFKDPILYVQSSPSTFDATKDVDPCLQVDETSVITDGDYIAGVEDCLYLNIYRHEKAKSEKLPVMVFIYGGGYMSGSGDSVLYGPQRFMDREIVLVTFNYRLGPFGFLSTGDAAAPGNYALLDTLCVLRYVKLRIAEFGGDPGKVTIFGESAGSSIVSLLILSPLVKGLFHAAILQSGNALADWGFEFENPLKSTVKLAKELNCEHSNTTELIKCLQTKSAMDILTKSVPIPGASYNQETQYTFRPTVDKSRGDYAFLPHPPIQQLLKGDINKVPTISGITQDEGLMFYLMPAIMIGGINVSDSRNLKKLLTIGAQSLMADVDRGKRAVEMIRYKYFKNVNESDVTERMKIMNKVFGGDSDASTDNFNDLLARRGVRVYPFKLSYRGKQSWLETESTVLPKNFIHDLQMVAHGDDLQYIFRSKYFNDTNLNESDRRMADVMLSLWTNFAKTKIPTFDEKSNTDHGCHDAYQWDVFNHLHPSYLDLNIISNMVDGYLCEDRDFWNNVYTFRETCKLPSRPAHEL